MIRRTSTAAAVLVCAALLPAASAERAPQAGEPTLGPLVSGTSTYRTGTYVWTDYAYDDRGADADGRPGGDEVDLTNAADLVQLQLRPVGRVVRATAVLETLTPATRPLVGIALDLDGPGRGAASLPGSWTAAAPLGVDVLLVLGRSGGRVLRASGDEWRAAGSFAVRVDDALNTVRADLPVRLPGAGTVRAVTVVGAETAAGSWLTGDAPVQDLGFVDDGWQGQLFLTGAAGDASGFATGGTAYWQDARQAQVLAGSLAPAAAVATIDVGALRGRRTTTPRLDAPGFETFLYRSRLDLGEGVKGSGNSALYAGPYQPYLVHLPRRPRPGLPLLTYLHGSSQIHTSPVNTSHHDPASRLGPVPLPDKVLSLDAVIAWPLGRGPQLWYEGASEQDALDVTDDVLSRLRLDRERVMLAGLSMGGYGTFRLGELYPDRWSSLYSDVGADRAGLLENLTNVPLRFQNGLLDPLVNPQVSQDTRDRVSAVETLDQRSFFQLRNTHAPAALLAECVYEAGLSRRRSTAPVRVRYTVDPAMRVVDRRTGLRLVYEGAWWVSGMRPAGTTRASVDLVTEALGRRLAVGPLSEAVRENVSAGRDFCGPNPAARGADVWTEQARAVREVPAPAAGRLTGRLTGLSEVTLDVARAGLTRFGSSLLRLTSDRAVTVRLVGLPAGTRLSAAGRTSTVNGDALVRLPAGTSTVALRRG